MPADIVALVLKIAAVFGGINIVIMAVISFFAKRWLDRSLERHKTSLAQETERLKADLAKEAETHKLKLRKQEILYNRQLDAATEFIDLHQKMKPQYTYPEKEWDDACDDVAGSFSTYEDWLRAYVRKHGAVINTSLRKLLEECILLASTNKFFGGAPGEVSREQNEAADKFLKTLESCEEKFLAEVQS